MPTCAALRPPLRSSPVVNRADRAAVLPTSEESGPGPGPVDRRAGAGMALGVARRWGGGVANAKGTFQSLSVSVPQAARYLATDAGDTLWRGPSASTASNAGAASAAVRNADRGSS